MVVKFRSGRSIRGALYYNEKKVPGAARLLLAEGFHKDKSELSFSDKLNRFKGLTERSSAKHNCVHISLNFSPKEKLSRQRLQIIAQEYMQGVGFGDQPYLVYEHFDAGHQHIHIVSTPIQRNGRPIDLHNLVFRKSEPSRKLIEIRHGLVKAEEQMKHELERLKPADIQAALYGKSETKKAITDIVRVVVEHYKFESFEQLNTILKQFNVMANRGEPGSRMYEKSGLTYSLIDQWGRPVGNAIKASSIYDGPTLAKLNRKFERNRGAYKDLNRVRAAIDAVLLNDISIEKFKKGLKKSGIRPTFFINETGRIYGVTYVDHKLLIVVKGSELGKAYSANALQEKLSRERETSEEEWNRKFVDNVLEQTDYNAGVMDVLKRWAFLGMSIDSETDRNGVVQYYIGHTQIPRVNWSCAPAKVRNYLEVNNVPAFHDTQHLLLQPACPVFSSVLSNLENIMINAPPETLLYLGKLLEGAFERNYNNNFVDPELLKEAMRKRRR